MRVFPLQLRKSGEAALLAIDVLLEVTELIQKLIGGSQQRSIVQAGRPQLNRGYGVGSP